MKAARKYGRVLQPAAQFRPCGAEPGAASPGPTPPEEPGAAEPQGARAAAGSSTPPPARLDPAGLRPGRFSQGETPGGGASDQLTPARRTAFRRRLLAWYQRNARDLPWRRTRDPYCIWVSEIMLQQTQVATVIPYYERFIRKFPTLQALAAADEQPVLRLWEGLGYYRRARQLHRAARRVCDAHGGEVPRDLEELRRLPGIGRYTASAIVSLAHDDRAPILEANTRRLYARLLGERGEVHTAAGEQRLIEFARQLLPRRQAGRFNQALMELGATVCLARSPRCTACPLADFCAARMQGLESSIPRPARRPRTEYVRQAVLVVRHQDRVLLLKRPDGERWAGLWDFARLPVEAQAAAQGNGALHRLAADLRRQTGVRAIITRKLATLKHSVTRFRISLDCYLAECPRGAQPPRLPANGRWVSPGQLEHYPLSTTARKLARMMVDTTSAP